MECSKIRSRLTVYLAHELPLDERSPIRQHLDQCPECQDELAALAKLDQLLDLQPMIVPPVELSESIMAAIAQTEAQTADDLSVRQVLVRGTALSMGLFLALTPLLFWWWQRRTGLTLLESISIWRSMQAAQLTGTMGLWRIVLAARQWLLSLPGWGAAWFQNLVGSLTGFLARHVLQIGLAAIGTVVIAILAWKSLSRWTERLDEGMVSMRQSRRS